jgi:hypothetical protein
VRLLVVRGDSLDAAGRDACWPETPGVGRLELTRREAGYLTGLSLKKCAIAVRDAVVPAGLAVVALPGTLRPGVGPFCAGKVGAWI